MFLKAVVVAVCLFKLTSTQPACECSEYSMDPCNSFNMSDTIEPIKSMLRSTSTSGKKFVLVTSEKTSWFRADNICRFNGMQLAIINSADEQQVISNLIDRSEYQNDGIWTSGTDLACQKKWYWSSNGNPIKYFNWMAGEPNSLSKTNERCINLKPKNAHYMWNDAPCDHPFYFICEEE